MMAMMMSYTSLSVKLTAIPFEDNDYHYAASHLYLISTSYHVYLIAAQQLVLCHARPDHCPQHHQQQHHQQQHHR